MPDVSTVGRLRAWRYAYNDAGDLVGTSDARGCGVNFHYDGAGRLLAEDYSPCEAQHAEYGDAPNLATGENTEVFYEYDGPGACAKGKLVYVKDRASSTATDYDCRGRVTNVGKQVALPGAPSTDPSSRYATRVYTQSMTYDVADRPVTQSTGATHTHMLGAGAVSTVTTSYTARGTVKTVTSSYGDLVTKIVRDAEGKVLETVYGDAAETKTKNTYYDRRRLRTVQTYREAPTSWGGAESGPSRTVVVEELLRPGQHRAAGWRSLEGQVEMLEVEAQDHLLKVGPRLGWTEAELSQIARARVRWAAQMMCGPATREGSR